jgi:UDP-N-acetylmuramoyl-L-alanyl-D-glutamate--2,6-diaminopimelate ligase
VGAKSGYIVEPDRRAAITLAIEESQAGDIVVIAGKGHENYQLVGPRKLPFDDREVAREAISSI